MVGKDLWRSSGPVLLPKQGQLEPFAQDRVQTAFEYLQGERLHNLFGNLLQCSVTLVVKKCFLMFRGNLLWFCPLPFVLSLGTTEKSLALSSLHPPFRYLYTLIS